MDSISFKKEVAIDSTTIKPTKGKKKESIGETFLSLGKGFLNRLKYRFNLEAVEEKVDKVGQKLKSDDKKSN